MPALSVEQIRVVVSDYFRDKPVKKVWLFGSYARGEADDQSDVDLLVAIDYNGDVGWGYYYWRDELAERFSLKVDVVSINGLSKYIGPYILAEKMLVYENSPAGQRAA